MNFLLLGAVTATGYISGTLSIRYVPDSFKWSLLAVSLAFGTMLGWIIPPQFNAPVCFAVASVGAIPVLTRVITDWREATRKRAKGRRVMEALDG